ncbi:FAD/NAD(P)-binding domain-containing protein [Mytilinidion resinicola]|uniref:FAD/NAD(P)-binding domain-containing protein n=1 Tax=Mytilinidion resinicola TaxID=574789 RepID=A0A6A6Y9N6_9PEZI|nr:FAD/NAD(P)-binding domain-containing protein [Mytilinidion resinicola]KAF2804537.1 FAD/NAD(P)-binding domain-containing protein [Mytilinidion resinicola]
MERTYVIIVGAGPSGLALALALAHQQVKCILLEANLDICEDPRAIAIAGDTHRILQLLGINQEKMKSFGQPLPSINIHRHSFTAKPFLTINYDKDWLQQGLANGTTVFQPKLEQSLRDLVNASDYADLRTECQVLSCRPSEEGVEATYDNKGTTHQLKGAFLVGADGKRGTVRKDFLEPFGIKQEYGIHEYEATWIAANLRVNAPTPESHPKFPLWNQGFKSDELWDLFWPSGFHFCNHPTMPVAAGRFGPVNERLWRFEYELPQGQMPPNLNEDLQKQLERHLTIQPGYYRGKLITSPVVFPWDCVEIMRCQPALFAHKVVNRWFDNRTILIGDAAHVFPPFGAQGIANGVRDAIALSWRIALMIRLKSGAEIPTRSNRLLYVWSQERRKGVNDSSVETMRNGALMRNKSWIVATVLGILNGYVGVPDGFFQANAHGGSKTAQIWVKATSGSILLTDELFWKPKSIFTLLIVSPIKQNEAEELELMLEAADLPPNILAHEIPEIRFKGSSSSDYPTSKRILQYTVCELSDLEEERIHVFPGYDHTSFRNRLRTEARYVLIRPDFVIYSQASTLKQLVGQLQIAKDMLAT